MASEPILILEVPSGGAVERQLGGAGPIADGRAVLEGGPTDAEGNLEAAAAGEIVMSVPSPEALRRDARGLRRAIEGAGGGAEPLVVEVEAAEELRADELDAVLAAAEHSRRAVILRIVRDA